MPLKEIMVDGGTLGHKTGSLVSGGTFTITAVPSPSVKIGTGVFSGPLAFTFAGGNATGFVPGTLTGGGSIPPTATKTKSDFLPVVRKDDELSVTFSGTTTPNPPGTPGTIVGVVVVKNAGQTYAKAD